jgi:hypothetical protein
MVTETLDSDKTFEQLVEGHSGKALELLENLWKDCKDKSESDLTAIIKAFNPQIEKWNTRLNLAKIDNGDLVSEAVRDSQKKYPTSEFGSETVPRFDSKTGAKLEPVTRYFYKKGIGRIDVDKATLKQFNKLKEEMSEENKSFLTTAEKFREAEAEWNKFKKNPESFTPDQFGQLQKKYSEAEKAYNNAIVKIGLTRDKFDGKGADVKTYIKGLQLLKKADIANASARVSILRTEVKIVQAILNKKRGNKNIEDVRKSGLINTGMIDSDIEGMVELPAEKSKVTADDSLLGDMIADLKPEVQA